MIQISPAILVTDKNKLLELLEKYIEIGFKSIDIDIQEEPFASDPTVRWIDALEIVSKVLVPTDVSIGFDLKLGQPKIAVEAILAQADKLGVQYRTYIYSTAQIDFPLNSESSNSTVGIGILGDVNPKGVEYLSKFPEIQLMTIKSERQGSRLNPRLLDRVTELRDQGYEGLISLDGGVNLNSAELINAYAKEVQIDRVSVGSFFQKSSDLEADKQKLEIALNIGVQ